MSTAGRDALVAMLSRLKNDLAGLNLSKPEMAQTALQAKYPLNGDYLLEVRRLCQRGIDDGWLCSDGAGAAKFSRVAPPSKYFPFSIDAVHLGGEGKGHGHPKGEINIAWALDGKPKFCGSDPGWIVFAPGSRHVPVVTGGSMLLLYFLPGGQVAWETRPEPVSRSAPRTRSHAASRPQGRRAAARG